MSSRGNPLCELPCLCATARRAARALTQLYDSYLRPTGIEASQFALLTSLQASGGRSQHDIAEMLAFDKTTLSRNLKLLERKGWITLTPSGDKRRRTFVLTSDGMRQIQKAVPHWQRAQQEVRARLKEKEWRDSWTTLAALARASRPT